MGCCPGEILGSMRAVFKVDKCLAASRSQRQRKVPACSGPADRIFGSAEARRRMIAGGEANVLLPRNWPRIVRDRRGGGCRSSLKSAQLMGSALAVWRQSSEASFPTQTSSTSPNAGRLDSCRSVSTQLMFWRRRDLSKDGVRRRNRGGRWLLILSTLRSHDAPLLVQGRAQD